MTPKISVVTVSFNSAKTIERTIESVVGQNYPHVEYIIIDGSSTDGTLDIVSKFKDRISIFVSEPDKGIYDAMNKGASLATGDFIHFLNSDDWYVSEETLSEVVAQFQDMSALYYGRIIYHHEDGRRSLMGHSTNRNKLKYELKGFHQPATFFPRVLFLKNDKFSLDYRVSADYELMKRFFSIAPAFFLNMNITNMADAGYSVKQKGRAKEENIRISIATGEGRLNTHLHWAWVEIADVLKAKVPGVFFGVKKIRDVLLR